MVESRSQRRQGPRLESAAVDGRPERSTAGGGKFIATAALTKTEAGRFPRSSE
jgi:hypothetical protein